MNFLPALKDIHLLDETMHENAWSLKDVSSKTYAAIDKVLKQKVHESQSTQKEKVLMHVKVDV